MSQSTHIPSFPARSSPPLVRGLERPRLTAMLEQCWTVPLTVVAAPAGSGKSWLFAGFAQAEHGGGRAVLWYQADRATVDDTGLVHHLFAVLEAAGLMAGPPPSSVEAFVVAAQGPRPAEVVLVVDDAHVLAGSRAEAMLGRLVDHLPPWLHLALLSRQQPGVDLSRLRVADQLLDIGPDELRFRSWEVEDLFRRHHGHDLPPEEIAELARRTGGWAAGLHLFHLAIKGKPPAHRHQVLLSLPTRLRTCRDYLTENVLARLDEDLRRFLVDSSVLGVLSGATCNALLERCDSAVVLEQLSSRHLFLTTNDGVTYRMHEVLRGHLDQLLFERLGDEAARAHCLRAAHILEAEGVLGEAWQAYCRAQDWESARRLLHNSGGELMEATTTWWEPLPGAVAGNDAWVLLARARRQVLAGRWRQALETFRLVEGLADLPSLARTCTEELMALQGWVEASSTALIGWSGTLRRALTLGPSSVARRQAGAPADRLVAAVAALLAGSPSRAWDLLGDGLESASPALQRWATLVAAFSGCLLKRSGSRELAATAAADLEPTLPPWMARLLGVLAGGEARLVTEVALATSEVVADTANPWAEVLLTLVAGGAAMLCGDGAARPQSARSLELAEALGSRTLQAWASVLVAVLDKRDGLPGADQQLRAAARLGRSVGCPGVELLAEAVRRAEELGAADPATFSGLSASDVALWLGVAEWLAQLPQGPEPPAGGEGLTGRVPGEPAGVQAQRRVQLRCFGDFELSIGDVQVDLARAQPKVRAVMHVLAANAGRVVHRDRLAGAVWSGDGTGATRNLQVAVSSLRKFLDAAATSATADGAVGDPAADGSAPPGPGAMIARHGDGYVLELETEQVDVLRFNEALGAAQSARARGDTSAAMLGWQTALETYRGDLLAGEGTADWLVDERELFRGRAAEAAAELAAHLLEAGDGAGALRAANRGLEIDRYRDNLWRTTISAHELAGDPAAAARATADYGRMLEELGVTTSTR